MTITYKGSTYKVRGNGQIPNLNAMDEIAARLWILQNTYARGRLKSNPLARLGKAITVTYPPIGDSNL